MNKREELKAMLASVDRLADAMKAKLRKKAAEGYHGGLEPRFRPAVAKKLHEHVARLTGYCDHCGSHDGDHSHQEGAPQAVDVCNLALMLWVLGGEGLPEMIHWASTPRGTCYRKDVGIDRRVETMRETTITQSAEANHLGNVTCPVCREHIRQQRKHG